ncbi:RNA polymerase sigma factor SigA1 [Porphyridium purpureum]|uniref:RNA polymerase sigma factor SigA1 n=1 Tax=Porphyridium purpureum TaxID=35688 RepID=A0A5J4ZAJ1_PORPP|nr:RNA polymerase sigma factor SigA1 [Porphyridium purpureum]|eukprot:POR5393..scf295_1
MRAGVGAAAAAAAASVVAEGEKAGRKQQQQMLLRKQKRGAAPSSRAASAAGSAGLRAGSASAQRRLAKMVSLSLTPHISPSAAESEAIQPADASLDALFPVADLRFVDDNQDANAEAESSLPVAQPVESAPQRRVEEESIFKTYLREIGSVEMLTDEELQECCSDLRVLLAWSNVNAVLAEQLGREPNVREWCEAVGTYQLSEFCTELQRLRKSKDKLVAANLRLVVSIAKRYAQLGVNVLDLVQEGSLGLIHGAEKFDISKGFRFATYVSWWIKQRVQAAVVNHSRAIRLPSYFNTTARKLAKVRNELSSHYGRNPSNEELARALDLSVERVKYITRKEKETHTVSLDVPTVYRGSTVCLGDMLECSAEQPEEACVKSLMKDDLEAVLFMLSPREREIVRLRYGMDDGNSRNYDEIGSLYCVPGNRIRQIEARALRKLRSPRFNASLRDYIKS